MDDVRKSIETLKINLKDKEKMRIFSYEEFLELTKKEPQRVLRNIFQLFHDMVQLYIGNGEDEYPEDPESIGFIKYDCSRIFTEGSDNPFFPDRLFANRFIRQVESLKQGSQQNRIYIYEGPHGCGKSTFLNNFLRTFEKYTETEEGQSFEIFWDLEIDNSKVRIFCPSHDHPLLLIPKSHRADFIDKLLSEKMTEFKHKLSNEKEYEWLFEREVCTICKSIFWALLDKLGSLDEVLGMAKVRYYKFDRRLGEGISVFNPGDKPAQGITLSDKLIQGSLDKIFGANVVKYIFSLHAKTNNGIYVLTDIKSHNKERLLELHNIISEGVHKVNGTIEERVSSLFLALMNPEDKEAIVKEEGTKSFQGRIQYNKIAYVMDVPTEVKIYHNVFGNEIDLYFLPRVLDNFARVIISSRMNTDCPPLKEWLSDTAKYKKYCDESGLLVRMELYGGVISSWLSEEDKKKLTASMRRKLIAEGEREGNKGFSGRDSIRLFGEFFHYYSEKPGLINMSNVADYFKHRIGREQRNENIPKNFIAALIDWYNYLVLGEVKESLYFYNEEQISKDILNYIWAVSYDLKSKIRCEWTGQEFEVSIEFLKTIGAYFVGGEMYDQYALNFARDIQNRYTKVIAQERDKEITETVLYQELFTAYARNLKEKALEPFIKNSNFVEAVKCFRTKEFETFDTRVKEHVAHMISSLVNKFGYTERGAKEICLYVIDQKLVEKFSKK